MINPKKDIVAPLSWKLADIIKATSGTLICGDPHGIFSQISIDTRSISHDDIFLALKGDAHDGHDYLHAALEKGVRGFIIDKDKIPGAEFKDKGASLLAVTNPRKALGLLGAASRKRSNAKVVAITGSNGKTTTRKMTSCVLTQRYKTLSTRGNFNNEIGLPLTLLNLGPEHEMAVVELGMNAPGEIRYLARISAPDVGVITNIGPAHLKGLGSLSNVMRAKGEILEGIKPSGIAVLNADDHRVMSLAKGAGVEVITYGHDPKAHIRAESLLEDGEGISFNLILPGESIPVRLSTPGAFMVSNALGAGAVGYASGLSPEEIARGLKSFSPAKGRMKLIPLSGNIRLIDDTYNANPGSMKAAIETLVSLSKGERSILIAGDMYELGERERQMHREIGEKAAELGVNILFATGQFAPDMAEGALDKGMKPRDIFTGPKDQIVEKAIREIGPGTTIIVKGSRAMAMETIVKELENHKF